MTATYADFLADPKRVENTVVIIAGYDRSALVERTLYFSSDDFATGATETPASQLFDKRVIGGFSRSTTAVGGDLGLRDLAGLIPTQIAGTITLKQYFGDLDLGTAAQLVGTPLRFYSFGGRSIQVLHGGRCNKGVLPLSAYRTKVSGVCEGEPKIGIATAEFRVKGQEERLLYPVQGRTFLGTDRCIVFNGSSTAIDCGTNAAFSFTSGAFSGSLLIYKESYPAVEEVLISHGLPGTDGWDFRLSTAGKLKLTTYQAAAASQVTISEPIPLHTFFEGEFTRTGAVVGLFIDGEDVVETAGVHINPAASTTRNLYIGRNNAGTVFFEGALDEIRIKSGATTEDGFEELMLRPLEVSEQSSFLLYLNCDDGDGSVATLDNKGSLGAAADGTATDAFCASSCMGTIDFHGRRMPSTWGQYAGFTPTCVDPFRQIYVVHGARSEELSTVKVGGYSAYNRIFEGDAEGADFTSWLDFIVATTAPGAVDTCLSEGWTLFRIGGEPEKKITVSGKGDKSDGTYRDTVGSICRYVLTTAGEQPFNDATEIYDAAWDDFEADFPATVGYTFSDDRQVATMTVDLCKTYHAAIFARRTDGKLSIVQIGDPATETALDTLTRSHVGKGSLVVAERGTPFWKWIFRYAENPTVMGNGDLYLGLAADDADSANFARQQWRKTERISPAVKRVFKDAGTYDIATRFVEREDAHAEKVRYAALSATPDQGFEFSCRPLSVDLEFGSVVYFHYQDRDKRRQLQDRFSATATAKFYVVGISDAEKGGGYTLNLWRPRVV